ncbi:YmfL family putative regulatory protein [Paraburkholderia sp. UCT2]|uniref:YmfL family putative regulatory protein n=1 Tax=Paraburkholderia sp. UCT2 TaxID=2615208 RepID=UPI001655F98E|nr:YmfL family putative regulatory protein [Paraburkholderia sp. UCT2]MBC8730014.1 hypothetical protein [Paraburkholderia sp. UCT2]
MIGRQIFMAMIGAARGGWETVAAYCGMSVVALENRIYQKKDQRLHLDTAMLIQEISGTTLLVEEIARLSGGVFIRLPDVEVGDRDAVLRKWNEIYIELGRLSGDFNTFTADDEVTESEFEVLQSDAHRVVRAVEELAALTHRVYGRPAATAIALASAKEA